MLPSSAFWPAPQNCKANPSYMTNAEHEFLEGKLQTFLHFEPHKLCWNQITYSLPSFRGQKVLLRGCNGDVEQGEMAAILGPSGDACSLCQSKGPSSFCFCANVLASYTWHNILEPPGRNGMYRRTDDDGDNEDYGDVM